MTVNMLLSFTLTLKATHITTQDKIIKDFYYADEFYGNCGSYINYSKYWVLSLR